MILLLFLWPLVAAAQEPGAVVAWAPLEWAAAIGGPTGVLLSVAVGWYTLKEKRRKDAEAAAAPMDAIRAEVVQELKLLRADLAAGLERAALERAEMQTAIAEMNADLYPRHSPPLAVQVRDIAQSAQGAPEAVERLAGVLVERLNRLEQDLKAAGNAG